MSPIEQFLPAKRSLFYLILGAWGKTAINCFVLITGYYVCKSRIGFRKVLKLLLEVEFYKITIHLIFVAMGKTPISFWQLVRVIVPVSSVSNGFTSCYLVFYAYYTISEYTDKFN